MLRTRSALPDKISPLFSQFRRTAWSKLEVMKISVSHVRPSKSKTSIKCRRRYNKERKRDGAARYEVIFKLSSSSYGADIFCRLLTSGRILRRELPHTYRRNYHESSVKIIAINYFISTVRVSGCDSEKFVWLAKK